VVEPNPRLRIAGPASVCFASLLIQDGKHSIVQISEWMGHSPATLLSHYAHVIADLASKPSSPNENAIKVARRTRRFYGQRGQQRSRATPSLAGARAPRGYSG
jgi:hypothetical protein